jgi:hypothetical protein
MSDSIKRHKFVLSLSICDLENYRLVLSLSCFFSFWLYQYSLHQPIISREIEHLNEIKIDKYVTQMNEQSNN